VTDKELESNLISKHKQDQKVNFHSKVFNQSADKDFNSGYASLNIGEPALMALTPSLS
jgi:hypothetical protein